jgi:hypothetical protein
MTLRSVALFCALWLRVWAGARVYGRTTPRQWIAQSPVVAVVGSRRRTDVAGDASDRQVLPRAQSAARRLTGSFEFFPHAEGFPGFHAGDRALLFLEATSKRVEFTTLAPRFPWFSAQGAGSSGSSRADGGGSSPGGAGATAARRTRCAHGARDLLAALGSAPHACRTTIAELVAVRALPGLLDADGGPRSRRPPTRRTWPHAGSRWSVCRGAPGLDARPDSRVARESVPRPARADDQVAGASDDLSCATRRVRGGSRPGFAARRSPRLA